MDYQDWLLADYIKQLKNNSDGLLSIDLIEQILTFLKDNSLLLEKPEVEIFKDPIQFMKDGFTEVIVGNSYNLTLKGEESYGLYPKYNKKTIRIILNSSKEPATISRRNSYTAYDVSKAGNAYGNYNNIKKVDGNFDVRAIVASLVTIVNVDRASELKISNTSYKICVYLGAEFPLSEADIAIAYILKGLRTYSRDTE